MTYEMVHTFASPPVGPNSLLQATDGAFYGTTQTGGTANAGTVFKMNAAGTVTFLHAFTRADGANPKGGLIQGSDGAFYGTTPAGGASGYGTVFKIDATGTFTSLHAFTNTDGAYPTAGLIQGSDGAFYGTTPAGGTSGFGTVFKVDATGGFTSLHAFTSLDGANPDVRLLQGSDGRLYGTTIWGGPDGGGVVIAIRLHPVDTSPPTTLIIDGPAGTIAVNNVSFTWTGSDNVTPIESLVHAYRLDPLEPSFSPFGSATSKTYSSLTNGPYTFYVKAKDQAGNVTPTPASQSFTVAVLPDLLVSSLSNPPATGVPGDSFPVNDTTLNQGSAAAAASTTYFYLSTDTTINGADIPLAGRAIPLLAASGGSSPGATPVTIPTGISSGAYYLGACADAYGVVLESSKLNNCRASTTTITIGGP